MRDDAALVSSFTALRYRDLCRASMVSEAAKRAAIALVLKPEWHHVGEVWGPSVPAV